MQLVEMKRFPHALTNRLNVFFFKYLFMLQFEKGVSGVRLNLRAVNICRPHSFVIMLTMQPFRNINRTWYVLLQKVWREFINNPLLVSHLRYSNFGIALTTNQMLNFSLRYFLHYRPTQIEIYKKCRFTCIQWQTASKCMLVTIDKL